MELWVYQNSFAGGGAALDCGGDSNSPNPHMTALRAINNIFSTELMAQSGYGGWAAFAYNWGGGFNARVKQNNIGREGDRMWPDATLPESFAPENEARDAGLDLAASFTLGSENFDPLPGMTAEYYADGSPDIGAIQGNVKP
jgi:hypothetical protein